MTSPFARTLASAVVVVACGGDDPAASRSAPASQRPEPSAASSNSPGPDDPAPAIGSQPRSLGPARDTPGVRFDCTRIAPRTPPRDCPAVPAPVIELVETAQADAHALTLHLASEARPHWARARAALDGMSAITPDALPIAVRVAAQNAALRIAFDAPSDPELVRSALAEVARLALPAEQLETIGTEPQGLEPWLGAREQWRTRERGEVVSLHAVIAPHAHYRMVQGRHRALAHQLVAIDVSGAPHLTPVVGELELRESDAEDATACVARIEVARLGCGQLDALEPIDASAHADTHFFHPKPDGSLGCNDCHSSSTFAIVDATRALQVEAAERRATLARIAERLRAKPGG